MIDIPLLNRSTVLITKTVKVIDVPNGRVSIHDNDVVTKDQIIPSGRQRVKTLFKIVWNQVRPTAEIIIKRSADLQLVVNVLAVPAALVVTQLNWSE